MKNYKVSYQRPGVGREEADQLAGFDQLLASAKSSYAADSGIARYAKGIMLMAAVATFVFFLVQKDSFEVNYPEPSAPEQTPESSESVSIDPTDDELEISEQIEVLTKPDEERKASPAGVSEEPKEEQRVEVEKDPEASSNTGFVEAEPVAGFDALYRYFDENLRYPEEIIENEIEGNVIIRFVIDTEGSPSKVSVEKSLHEKIDSVALELINNMPHWKPATLHGRPLPSTHRIPLFFQIDKTEE